MTIILANLHTSHILQKAPCQKKKEDYNEILLFMVAGCFRLSDWGPAMEHGEPGQVGNQAALSRSFHVSDSIPADDLLSSLRADISHHIKHG